MSRIVTASVTLVLAEPDNELEGYDQEVVTDHAVSTLLVKQLSGESASYEGKYQLSQHMLVQAVHVEVTAVKL